MGKVADNAKAAADAVTALQSKATALEASLIVDLIDIQARAMAAGAKVDAYYQQTTLTAPAGSASVTTMPEPTPAAMVTPVATPATV